MTVCVAAYTVSPLERALVMASDEMASVMSGACCIDENMLKVAPIHRMWAAMFSAEDVTPVEPIMRRVMQELCPDGFDKAPAVTVSMMQGAFKRGYQAERAERTADALLSPYQLDMSAFNRRALELFGDNGAAVMRDRIERFEFDCEFLVCGFDKSLEPHIFTVSNPGVVRDYDTVGYWAVGSGSFNALSALALRGHSMRHSLESTIYNVCEAKFAAENAVAVGKASFVVVHRPDGRWASLSPETVEHMRAAWTTYGKPRAPIEALTELSQWVSEELPTDHANGQSSKPTSSSGDQT